MAKIGIAVASFLLAIWFAPKLFSSGDDGPQPGDHLNYYICADCKEVQKLNDQQIADTQKYVEHVSSPPLVNPKKPAGRFRGVDAGKSYVVIKCSKCGHIAARVAALCPKDKEIFIAQDDKGELTKCPKCGTLASLQPGS